MIKRIHVNRHNIAYNKRHINDGEFIMRMPFTVKTYKDNYKVDYVECLDRVRLVYSPDKPLPCGAVAWMETEGDVIVDLDNLIHI